MNPRRTLFSLLLALPFGAAFADEKPNFVVILCDDLGYNDIGPFGSEQHRTPNLDRMAEEGMIFTDFYVTSGVCSPSRASIMTGSYPKRIGLHQNETGQWVLFPGNSRGLNPEEITIAEVLKEEDYATGMVGKWHLGDQPEYLPTRQGFDYYYGIPYSNDMGHQDRPEPYKYPPLPLLRNEEVIEEEPDQRQITRNYTREAIAFMALNRDKPFFLYLPHTMPHWPQYSSRGFAGKSANGPWGDTVEEIDWSTGQILKAIEDLGIADNTMVVFFSDNGGATRHGASNAPLSGAKGSTMEGGQRVPFVAWWPGKIPAGTENNAMASSMDLMPTFAQLAGTTAPTDRIIDGKNIWPLLSGEETQESPHEALFYYYRGDLQAVRSGDWKLRVAHDRRPKKGESGPQPVPVALYNLAKDIAEETNVASANPEVLERLQAFADQACEDLGDDGKGVEGSNLRPPGHVDNAVPLTSN